MMGWIAGLYLSDYLDRNLDVIQKHEKSDNKNKDSIIQR